MNENEPTLRGIGREIRMPALQLASCGDISCEFLIDPIPRPEPDPIKVAVRPKKREVVLFDSNKPNSLAIMQATQALLRERGIPVQDEIRVKLNASLPMPDDQMEAAAREEGLLVCGVND